MMYSFPTAKVKRAIELMNNDQARVLLVGDHGVYIMVSNGEDHTEECGTPNFCIYAKGCDPKVDDFDTWWANKENGFGSSDGSDPLDLEGLKDWVHRNRYNKSASMIISVTSMRLI